MKEGFIAETADAAACSWREKEEIEGKKDCCDRCGRRQAAAALQPQGAEGWLCPFCLQEIEGCGCED